jgi:hypothetical protein
MSQSATKQQPLLSKQRVDVEVNAVFTAFLRALGESSFTAGSGRNMRRIVNQWNPLVQVPMDGAMSPRAFYAQYAPSQFFERYFYAEELGSSKALQDQAKETFLENVRRGWAYNVILPLKTKGWFRSVIATAQLKIQRVLGEFSIEAVFAECGHGPNSTVTVRKRNAFLDRKYLNLSGTEGALRAFAEYLHWDENLNAEFTRLQDLPAGEYLKPEEVPGNALSFVPKKWNKLRTMSAEGTLNQFFQLGTGRVIQTRLRKCNIDLSTQPDVHRRLVKLMSRYPEIGDATLDWSQASDRIWSSLVQMLVDGDWYSWFDQIRSPVTTFGEGEVYDLPMIGTMGNGFVFPLQTLVFWGLLTSLAEVMDIRSVGISVFGDDCIVPIALVPWVEVLAKELGWSLNSEKSFSEGRFRESCGLDAYMGRNVRPFFIERPEDVKNRNALKSWSYVVFNGLRRSLDGRGDDSDLWQWLFHFHEEYNLGKVLLVPPRFGDGSGVQTPDCVIRHISRFGIKAGDIPGGDETNTLYPSWDRSKGVWDFRYLRNRPSRYKVLWEFPWYHVWLRGHTVPSEFKPSLLSSDGHVSGITDESTIKGGQVRRPELGRTEPRKENRVTSSRISVHTWEYWLEIPMT